MARKHTSTTISFFAFQDIITSVVGIFLLVTLIMALNVSNSQSREGQTTVNSLSETAKQLQEELNQVNERIKRLQEQEMSGAVASKGRREILERDLKQIEERRMKFESINSRTSQAIVAAEGSRNEMQEKSIIHDLRKEELDKLIGSMKYLETALQAIQANSKSFHKSALGKSGVVMVDFTSSKITIVPIAQGTAQELEGRNMVDEAKRVLGGYADDCHIFMVVRPGGVAAFNAIRSMLSSRNASFGFDAISDAIPTPGSGGK